jgi:hypothetical protein
MGVVMGASRAGVVAVASDVEEDALMVVDVRRSSKSKSFTSSMLLSLAADGTGEWLREPEQDEESPTRLGVL